MGLSGGSSSGPRDGLSGGSSCDPAIGKSKWPSTCPGKFTAWRFKICSPQQQHTGRRTHSLTGKASTRNGLPLNCWPNEAIPS